MIVKSLLIENFFGKENYYAEYRDDIVMIDARDEEAVLAALGILLENVAALENMPPEAIREDTKLHAAVLLCGEEYTLRFEGGKKAAYCGKSDCTEEFYRRIVSSKEEQVATLFIPPLAKTYPNKLWEYSECLRDGLSDLFSDCTNDVGTTEMFRCALRRMIKNFCPQRFVDKEFVLSKKGRFEISDNAPLSEADAILYNCFCFFRVVDFWDDVASSKDMHYVKRPLFIWDVLGRLDGTKPLAAVLAEAKKANRQVFFSK